MTDTRAAERAATLDNARAAATPAMRGFTPAFRGVVLSDTAAGGGLELFRCGHRHQQMARAINCADAAKARMLTEAEEVPTGDAAAC